MRRLRLQAFRPLWACLQWLAPSVAVFLLPLLKGAVANKRCLRGQRTWCVDQPHETRAREGTGYYSLVHLDRVQIDTTLRPETTSGTADEGFPRSFYRGSGDVCVDGPTCQFDVCTLYWSFFLSLAMFVLTGSPVTFFLFSAHLVTWGSSNFQGMVKN